MMSAIEGVHFLKDNGFDAIDVVLINFHAMYGQAWREETVKLRDEIQKVGLLAESAHLPFRGEGEELRTRNIESIEMAGILGLEICWDFGHAHGAGLDQYSEIVKLGNRLKMTHINDNQGDRDEHIPPFYGGADWDGAVRALREIGYSHPLNFELKFRQLPMEIMPEAAALVRRIGELFIDRIFEK